MRGKDSAKIMTAVYLLKDKHLVWSSDFEAIREPLAALLEQSVYLRFESQHIKEVADAILSEEYDITI